MSEENAVRETPDTAFIGHLRHLFGREDGDGRAARAALRSGVGKEPGEAPRMFPYLARYLQEDKGARVRAMFLTAALFAKHDKFESGVNLGKALNKVVKSGKFSEDGVERRFTAALDAHPDDLPRHVEGLVSLCESAGVGLDWYRFYGDMKTLLGDREEIQVNVKTKLAKDFWSRAADEGHAQKVED